MNTSFPRPAAQRGGFVIGLVVGLLVGLALALGVALYVTKAPVPFINKVQPRPPGQDAAEAEHNRNWDPNSSLASKTPVETGAAASAPAVGTAPPTLVPPTVIDPNAVPPAPATTATVPRGERPPVAAAVNPPGAENPTNTARAAPPLMPLAGVDPFTYFVQAGAFARNEDAEQQRAKLAIIGIESRVTEREQNGRTVYRVRVGPFGRKTEADAAKDKLADAGVDSALVRVQK
ncbi:MAG TPA: SPOR domain-containing protein [Caldimonas sp.]|nr:SPOR domain-containing protein [Caldimonas sp.]